MKRSFEEIKIVRELEVYQAMISSKLEDIDGHTSEAYRHAHDCLTASLNKVGKATKDCDEGADFYLDSEVGGSLPITVVVEGYDSAATLLALRDALQSFRALYSVSLDQGEFEVCVSADGKTILVCADDDVPKGVLKKYGLV